jgi:hypothetical protein
VYRFIAPDGRSYVGSCSDSRGRADNGIQRKNQRLLEAFERHPPKTFTFEILERLPPGCTERRLRKAEQRHIDRLPTLGLTCCPQYRTATVHRTALPNNFGK